MKRLFFTLFIVSNLFGDATKHHEKHAAMHKKLMESIDPIKAASLKDDMDNKHNFHLKIAEKVKNGLNEKETIKKLTKDLPFEEKEKLIKVMITHPLRIYKAKNQFNKEDYKDLAAPLIASKNWLTLESGKKVKNEKNMFEKIEDIEQSSSKPTCEPTIKQREQFVEDALEIMSKTFANFTPQQANVVLNRKKYLTSNMLFNAGEYLYEILELNPENTTHVIEYYLGEEK